MSLDFPLLGRSRIIIFSVLEGEMGPCFCCVFCPLSGGGNSGLRSTPPFIQVFTVPYPRVQGSAGRIQESARVLAPSDTFRLDTWRQDFRRLLNPPSSVCDP